MAALEVIGLGIQGWRVSDSRSCTSLPKPACKLRIMFAEAH